MISTKNIKTEGGSSVPKTLSPGNVEFKIYDVRLEAPVYKQDAYNVILNVEGPALGDDFEGFFVDKDDPSKGRYAGQVGRVRLSEYPFADGTTKKGVEISRDAEMLKALQQLCKNLDCVVWFESQDEKHDTIESLYEKFNSDKPYIGKYLRACVAGKEYTNKAGYASYDLYLPKWSKSGVAYESARVDEVVSKVVKFDPEVHIKKNTVSTVTSFGENITTTSSIADDFVL